jgi:tetratricopeptide (TPR) repeat protein
VSLKKTSFVKLILRFFIVLSFCFASTDFVFAQDKTVIAQRAEAVELIEQNRYLDALPVLEKIILSYPNDAELWAHFGIAIISNSVTLKTPEARKKEQVRGVNALAKAKQLNTQNVTALNYLETFSGSDGNDNFIDANPEAENALREGEAFFGRGEYDKAFAAYEKAYKINPKSYEAILFMGDSLYAAKRYKESEVWFAKAVALEKNREAAYRYWGDALMNQKKILEARDKFVEAFVAEPFSRLTLDRLVRWVEEAGETLAPTEITPPGNDFAGELKIDEKLLKAENGTIHWKLYDDARKAQILENAKRKQSHTLNAEAAAWRKVADAARKEIKSGKLKNPDPSLLNLIKIDEAGVLEAYLLIMRPHEDFGEDFFQYREKNRDKLKQFVVRYLLGLKS